MQVSPGEGLMEECTRQFQGRAPVWPKQREQKRQGAVGAWVLKGHKDFGLDTE